MFGLFFRLDLVSVSSKEYEIKDGFTASLGRDLDYSLRVINFYDKSIRGLFF